MTAYTKNKKMHMMARWLSGWNIWVKSDRPICKVDNRTSAYNRTWMWAKTTCKRCLEKKP
jgi:hypothetical protein